MLIRSRWRIGFRPHVNPEHCVPQNWGEGGRERVAEDALPETEQECLSTICPDIDARLKALTSIPYNEFAVQSRVAAYDAHQSRYGRQ